MLTSLGQWSSILAFESVATDSSLTEVCGFLRAKAVIWDLKSCRPRVVLIHTMSSVRKRNGLYTEMCKIGVILIFARCLTLVLIDRRKDLMHRRYIA